MKHFLLNESGELFYTSVETLADAEEAAVMWNAVVIGEVSKETMETVNPNSKKVKLL